MQEELNELRNAKTIAERSEEATDLKSVCENFLIHIGKIPLLEHRKVVEKNEKRALEHIKRTLKLKK